MNKFDVEMGLGRLADQRMAWSRAHREFNEALTLTLHRLIHEATRNMMSINEVARAANLPTKRVRTIMREMGLNPNSPRSLLAEQSAKALAENAALLGVEPNQIDLTSPLAYLPMGSQMKQKLVDASVARVTELPESDDL